MEENKLSTISNLFESYAKFIRISTISLKFLFFLEKNSLFFIYMLLALSFPICITAKLGFIFFVSILFFNSSYIKENHQN